MRLDLSLYCSYPIRLVGRCEKGHYFASFCPTKVIGIQRKQTFKEDF